MLGSIVSWYRRKTHFTSCDGVIDEDVSYKIKVGWLKWRQATGVLYNPRVPLKLNGKFYWTAIQLAMLSGAEY
jgi:hypothetical protein